MDEYVGLSPVHAFRLRRWIRTRLEGKIHPGKVYYLDRDAPDLDAEMERHTALAG
ncbi:MAG: glucosamine-6-phosphate deaminase [Bryobacterales bacterium]|jgi:glucosamine-6-phosphate deaminase|nr:glucosamine-6-phosphate deaminase [Bryobacterales bacterium]